MSVKLTEKAAQIFLDTCASQNLRSSYLRIGANPGGCSGWRYELETSEEQKEADLLFVSYGVNVLIDKTLFEDIIGPVTIDYNTSSLVEQGFVFFREDGLQCGCGESFTPYKSNAEYIRNQQGSS